MRRYTMDSYRLEAVEPWQRKLAVRVILQAFRDLSDGRSATDDRASARRFLAASDMLRYWCAVGSLDLRRITDRARRLA